MKAILFTTALLASLMAYTQTVADDLRLLLEYENVEDVEIVEYLKTKIDTDFLAYTLQRRTNNRQLILEHIAHYLDATLLFDGNGWTRLIPQRHQLYSCDVYSLDNKLSFYIPSLTDSTAYIEAERIFNSVYAEEVVKIHIQVVNSKSIKP